MHQNQHGQEAQDLYIKSLRFGLAEKALTDTIVLTKGHPSMLFLDAGASDKVVTLPAEELGLFFDIFNRSTTNRLTVKDDAGATVAVVYPRHSVQFVSTKDDWESFGHIFGEAGTGHKPGLVPDPGAVDNTGDQTLFLTENGWAVLGTLTTNDFIYQFTDGTNVSTPVGADIFKFRSSDSSLAVTVTNNEAVHGDNVNLTVNEAAVDHNALLNFVANEHIDHSAVNINTAANSGLAGGGSVAATRSLVLDLNNLTGATPVLADLFAFNDQDGDVPRSATLTALNAIFDHDALVNFSANEHIDHTLVAISAGPGLTGGGDISVSRTISLDITGQDAQPPATSDEFIYWDVGASDFDKCTVATLNGVLGITNLSGYVANEHINHTSVTLTAGAGLTGGGDISASRSFAVGAGTGITVNADDVAINQAFTPTWSGAHRFQSYLDFDEIAAPANPAANIARFYCKDNGSGTTKLYFRDSAGTETELGGGGSFPVSVANGGTGQTTEAEAIGELTQALSTETTIDWQADFLAFYDASADTGKKALFSSIFREKVLASRVYYVRKDGSDTGTTGLTDDTGAFLTIGKAMEVVGGLDLLSTSVVVDVQVRDNGSPVTYNESVVLPTIVGAGSMRLLGDTTTPSDITINSAGGNAISSTNTFGTWTVSGFKLTAASFGVTVSGPAAAVTLGEIEFGACGRYWGVSNGAVLSHTSSNITISGDGTFGMLVSDGKFAFTGNTVTITGKRTIGSGGGTAFAYVEDAGRVRGFSNTFQGPTCTITNASPGVVTQNGHGGANDDPVQFTTTGALPTGLSVGTLYYKRNVAANTFEVAATPGGASINTSSAGSGTHRAFSVTGNRFLFSQNSTVVINGAGANYWPGSTAGTGDPGTFDQQQ